MIQRFWVAMPVPILAVASTSKAQQPERKGFKAGKLLHLLWGFSISYNAFGYFKCFLTSPL